MARGLGAEPSSSPDLPADRYPQGSTAHTSNSSPDNAAAEEGARAARAVWVKMLLRAKVSTNPGRTRGHWELHPYRKLTTFSQTLRTPRCGVLPTDTNQKPTAD